MIIKIDMRIAAIVVTYHPRKDELYRNIKSFIEDVDTVLIWRNSDDDLFYLSEWGDKIHFIGNKNNEYIAKPLNSALSWCVENRYDYLLTMDQDSVWEDFHGFISYVRESLSDEVAIYAPNVNRTLIKSTLDVAEVESVITSGSLVKVTIGKEIGGFNEAYKIYWVDGEFCYRARSRGYKVLVLPQFSLDHKLGRQTKTLFGYSTSNYSSQVYYFMFRNMYWMHKEHGQKAVSIKCIIYTSLYNIRGIILGESNKLEKLTSIVKGTLVGIFKREEK